MKHSNYKDSAAWQNQLDSIARDDKASVGEDELLHLAGQLRNALAPLRELDKAAEAQQDRLYAHLRATAQRQRFATQTAPSAPVLLSASVLQQTLRSKQGRAVRLYAFIAAVLLLAFGLGRIGLSAMATVWNSMSVASVNQIEGPANAGWSRPHEGIHPLPLLPNVLPAGTQATAYGVITDSSDPNLLTAFVADYHIAGHSVLLYEQPAAGPAFVTSTTAKTIMIGEIQALLFQDAQGTSAIQWYQHNMQCQITSTLPVDQLIEIAATVQPLASWQVIL